MTTQGWAPPDCWPEDQDTLGSLIYLAGPMSSVGLQDEADGNQTLTHSGHARLVGLAHDASGIEAMLVEQGWHVFNPYSSVLNSRSFDLDPETWYETDRCWLFIIWMVLCMGAFDAAAILLLPGWENSVGAKQEKDFAQLMGLDVYEWVPETMQMVEFVEEDN